MRISRGGGIDLFPLFLLFFFCFLSSSLPFFFSYSWVKSRQDHKLRLFPFPSLNFRHSITINHAHCRAACPFPSLYPPTSSIHALCCARLHLDFRVTALLASFCPPRVGTWAPLIEAWITLARVCLPCAVQWTLSSMPRLLLILASCFAVFCLFLLFFFCFFVMDYCLFMLYWLNLGTNTFVTEFVLVYLSSTVLDLDFDSGSSTSSFFQWMLLVSSGAQIGLS
jgi:hypothetical protein